MKDFEERQPSTNQSMKEDSTNTCIEREQSIIIFTLVLVFIFSHTLRAVLNIQELVYFEWSSKDIARGCTGVRFWAMLLVPVSEFILLTNSSANFFIYYFFHKDFRRIISTKYEQIYSSFHSTSRTLNTSRDPHLTDTQVIFPTNKSNYEQRCQTSREPGYTQENLEAIEMQSFTAGSKPSL